MGDVDYVYFAKFGWNFTNRMYWHRVSLLAPSSLVEHITMFCFLFGLFALWYFCIVTRNCVPFPNGRSWNFVPLIKNTQAL
jgi:hypothetical protein